ncbi:MAG: phosphohistidine phosphatase SixA [Pseudomonadota bacterium]|jgi:phosphohistidine phosphatase
MQLILLRHGEAERQTTTDDVRGLTPRGQRQATHMMAQLLARMTPQRLLVSPLLRARQTLEPLQRALPQVPMMVLDQLKPDDDPLIALDVLSAYDDDYVVVVCHMNIIAEIAGHLTGEMPEPFELAEARCYDMGVVMAGLATECWRMTPPVERS